MRSPPTRLLEQHVFEAYVAALFGLVILAILIPPVVTARETLSGS